MPSANGALLRLLHVERRGERSEEAARVGDVGETDEGRAVGELGRERARDLGREARLADAAGPRHRHDPVRAHEADEVGELAVPAEQLALGLRQRRADRDDHLALPLELRPVGDDEAGAGDRVEIEWPADVLELERPERRDSELRLVPDLVVRRVRDEDGSGRPRTTRPARRR